MLKDFPWLVIIGNVDWDGVVRRYWCGGSLITMSVVLTASHCICDKYGALVKDT